MFQKTCIFWLSIRNIQKIYFVLPQEKKIIIIKGGGIRSLQITVVKILKKKGTNSLTDTILSEYPSEIDRSAKMDSTVVNFGILEFLVLGQWRAFSGPFKMIRFQNYEGMGPLFFTWNGPKGVNLLQFNNLFKERLRLHSPILKSRKVAPAAQKT